jgi:hypothetical protein
MFDVSAFLDRARAACVPPTDYRLAKTIGYTSAAVSQWRAGRTFPDERAVVKLCALSGDDADYVAVCFQAMRAANDDAASLWNGLAKRLQGTAGVLVVTAGAMLAWSAVSTSDTVSALSPTISDDAVSLYIMSSAAAIFIVRLALLTIRKRRQARTRHPA